MNNAIGWLILDGVVPSIYIRERFCSSNGNTCNTYLESEAHVQISPCSSDICLSFLYNIGIYQ